MRLSVSFLQHCVGSWFSGVLSRECEGKRGYSDTSWWKWRESVVMYLLWRHSSRHYVLYWVFSIWEFLCELSFSRTPVLPCHYLTYSLYYILWLPSFYSRVCLQIKVSFGFLFVPLFERYVCQKNWISKVSLSNLRSVSPSLSPIYAPFALYIVIWLCIKCHDNPMQMRIRWWPACAPLWWKLFHLKDKQIVHMEIFFVCWRAMRRPWTVNFNSQTTLHNFPGVSKPCPRLVLRSTKNVINLSSN